MGRNRKSRASVLLDYQVDDASKRNAAQSLEDLQRLFADLNLSQEYVAQAAKQLGINMSTAFDKTADSMRDASAATERVGGALQDATRDAERYEQELRTVRRGAEVYGDVASRLTAIGGLASGLGLRGAGELTMVVADVSDAVEALQLAGPAVEELGGRVTSFIKTINIPLPALGMAGIAAGLAVAGLAAAIDAMRADTEAARLEAERYIAATKEVTSGISTMTTEERKALIQRAEDQVTDAETQIAFLTRSVMDTIMENLRANANLPANVVAELNAELVQAFENSDFSRISEVVAMGVIDPNQVEQIRLWLTEITNAQDRIRQHTTTIATYNDEIAVGITAANDARIAVKGFFEQLKGTRGQVGDFLADLVEGGERLARFKAGQTLGDFFGPLVEGITDGVTQARDTITNALAEARDRDANLANIARAYTEENTRIWEEHWQARANAEQQYADELVKIAEDAAQAAADALTELEDTQSELSTDLQREQQQALIDDQREEVRLATEHARTMQRIRQQSARQEADLIARRDFAGLFRLRRNTREQLQDEQTAYSQRVDDAQLANEQEREDRLRHYQEQREDAADAYRREIRDLEQHRRQMTVRARESYNRDLQDLNTAVGAKLAQWNTAYTAELRMASLTAAQRTAIEAQTQATFLQIAQDTLAQVQALAPAGGGAATGGITPTGGKVYYESTFNLAGSDRQLVRTIDSRVERTFRYIMQGREQ